MHIVKTYKNNEIYIHMYENFNKLIFKVSELCMLIDTNVIKNYIQNYDDTEKIICPLYTFDGHQDVMFLTEKGIHILLSKFTEIYIKELSNWIFYTIEQIRLENKYKLDELIEENRLLTFYNRKLILYIIKINNTEYKFGITFSIKSRFGTHKKEIHPDIRLIYCFETIYNREVENMIKTTFKNNIKSIIYPGRELAQTEIIIFDDIITKDILLNKIPLFNKFIIENYKIDISSRSLDQNKKKLKHDLVIISKHTGINPNKKRFSCSGCKTEFTNRVHCENHINKQTACCQIITLNIVETLHTNCIFCNALIKTATEVDFMKKHVEKCIFRDLHHVTF
jgi:hypothetical protein